jgi:hypothetical protein
VVREVYVRHPIFAAKHCLVHCAGLYIIQVHRVVLTRCDKQVLLPMEVQRIDASRVLLQQRQMEPGTTGMSAVSVSLHFFWIRACHSAYLEHAAHAEGLDNAILQLDAHHADAGNPQQCGQTARGTSSTALCY